MVVDGQAKAMQLPLSMSPLKKNRKANLHQEDHRLLADRDKEYEKPSSDI